MNCEISKDLKNEKFNVVIFNHFLKSFLPNLVQKTIGIENINISNFNDLHNGLAIEGAIFIVENKQEEELILNCPFIASNNVAIFYYHNRKLKLKKEGLIFKQKSSLDQAQAFHDKYFEDDFFDTYAYNAINFYKMIALRIKQQSVKLCYSIKPA